MVPLILLGLGILLGILFSVLYLERRERAVLSVLNEFTSSVSHELRTPLAQILLFAETLELNRARDEQKRKEAVRIIAQEARHLSHVVENLLLFSRARRDMLHIETELVPLGPAVHEVLELFQQQPEGQVVTIQTRLAENVQVPLHRGALQQVLLNLLENAVKYGPPGQTVTVATELDGGHARLLVEDQGPGIPKADQARVWEPFVRLGSRNGASGTGVGLAVVKELVMAHQGRCWIDPLYGPGCRVVVELAGAIQDNTPATYPLIYGTR